MTLKLPSPNFYFSGVQRCVREVDRQSGTVRRGQTTRHKSDRLHHLQRVRVHHAWSLREGQDHLHGADHLPDPADE